MRRRVSIKPPLALIIVGVFAIVSTAAISQEVGRSSVEYVTAKRGTSMQSVRDAGYVEISGDIQRASVPRLITALAQAKKAAFFKRLGGDPIVYVYLNSRGGEIAAAIEMGHLLRSYAADVFVDSDAQCSSACILVLAGGVTREAMSGAKLGLHRPYFSPSEFAGLSHAEAQQKYSRLAQAVKSYLAEMGVADALYERMMRVPSRSVEFVSHGFAGDSKLLGKDPAHEEWQHARSLKAFGIERVQLLDQYTDCINAGRKESQCAEVLSRW